MRYYISLFIVMILIATANVTARNLIVVNGLGETADFVDLTDSIINQNVALLGLAPNDFVVSEAMGVALNSTSNDLYFFSLPSMAPQGTLYLGDNRNPYNGCLAGDDTLLVTNLIS